MDVERLSRSSIPASILEPPDYRFPSNFHSTINKAQKIHTLLCIQQIYTHTSSLTCKSYFGSERPESYKGEWLVIFYQQSFCDILSIYPEKYTLGSERPKSYEKEWLVIFSEQSFCDVLSIYHEKYTLGSERPRPKDTQNSIFDPEKSTFEVVKIFNFAGSHRPSAYSWFFLHLKSLIDYIACNVIRQKFNFWNFENWAD